MNDRRDSPAMLPPDLVDQTAAAISEVVRLPFHAVERATNGNNPSSSLDRSLSESIGRRLADVWDGHVLTEEDPTGPAEGTPWQWILDPIDGTINAINGSPDIAVSVALREVSRDRIRLAVVYLPHHQQVFSAFEAQGATVDGERLPDKAGSSLRVVAIGINEHGDSAADVLGRNIGQTLSKGWILRQSGSAAMDICRVASGVWSGFVELGLKEWDIAAADLIAREAGCVAMTRPTIMRSDWRAHSVDYIVARSQHDLDELTGIWF